MAVVGLLLLAPHPVSARFNAKFDPKSFPESALKMLRGDDTRRIFAEDQWGDYLIYNLYPTRQVFIDGRSDFYGDKFGLTYLDLIGVKYDWQKTLDQYAIDTIVIAPRFALASTLKLSHDWRVVFDDGHSIVFRRNRAEKVSLVSSDGGKDRGRAIAKPVVSELHGLKHGAIPTT